MIDLSFLSLYSGDISVNGEPVSSHEVASRASSLDGKVFIQLIPKSEPEHLRKALDIYRFTFALSTTTSCPVVSATNIQLNAGIAIPFRVMFGKIDEETKSLLKISVHAGLEESHKCTKCGRTIINPISCFYGIGPECATKYGIKVASKTEFDAAKEIIRRNVESITWSGWVRREDVKYEKYDTGRI